MSFIKTTKVNRIEISKISASDITDGNLEQDFHEEIPNDPILEEKPVESKPE